MADGISEPVTITDISKAMASAVQRVAPSVVSIDDGTRLTATGVIWSSDGVIVATSHGVERDHDLAVVTADGTRYSATLVGRDDETDIAVLRIDANGLSAIDHGQAATDAPSVGTLAIAVGRPGDAGLAATLGLVSARRDTETNGEPEYILYTDAILYPGFSGGAFVDAASGTFLGLLNRIYGRGLGVALGAPLVARVVASLLAHGRIPKGYLGVRTQLIALPDTLGPGLTRTQEHGLLVVKVEPGSPAEAAGLLLGDTLLGIDREPIEDVDDLRRYLKAGVAIEIQTLRGGALQDIAATVGTDKT